MTFISNYIRISSLKAFQVFSLPALVLVAFAFLGCEEEADNKTAKAQACFDKLTDTSPDADALACEAMVEGINSVHANVIRCSTRFFVGGVKSSELAQAFQDAESTATADRPAVLMAKLAQDSTTEADSTFSACNESGISSLIFIAGLSRVGTILMQAPGANANDPNTYVDYCQTNPCDEQSVGETILAVNASYCVGDNVETDVCRDIATAIANGNGDPQQIAERFFDAIDQ